MCRKINPFFHGRCSNSLNCANSCIHHAVGTGGYCKGWVPFQKECMCTFDCGGGQPPVPPPVGPPPVDPPGGGEYKPPGVKPLSGEKNYH